MNGFDLLLSFGFNLLLSFSSPGSAEQRDCPAATQESFFDVKPTWLSL